MNLACLRRLLPDYTGTDADDLMVPEGPGLQPYPSITIGGCLPPPPWHVTRFITLLPAPELDPASDSGVQGDHVTSHRTVTLTGHAAPGSTVRLFEQVLETIFALPGVPLPATDGELGTATTDAMTGAWQLTLTLAPGAHGIGVAGTDASGHHTSSPFPLMLTILPSAAAGDLDGNGTSDILWRHADGGLAAWSMDGASGSGAGLGTVDTAWRVAGTGDFDGDDRADILWQHADGRLASWRLGAEAGSTNIATVDPAWKVVATGDLNGDGRADILWRYDNAADAADPANGTVASWEMDGSMVTGGATLAEPGSGWTVLGLADFNGDGRDDILWQDAAGDRLVWHMDGTTLLDAQGVGPRGTNWHFAGLGDFDRDGWSDTVWRYEDAGAPWDAMNGEIVLELARTYSFDPQPAPFSVIGGVGGRFLTPPGPDWSIAKVGDYDGDGRADIIWRAAGGAAMLWLMDGLEVKATAGLGNPGADWMIA